MAFPKTLSAANAAAFPIVAVADQSTEAGFVLSEEHVNSIEATLSAADSTAAGLNAQVTQLTTDLQTANAATAAAEASAATLTTSLSTITAERDKFKADAIEFGAKTGTAADTAKENDPDKKGGKAFVSSMDEYAQSHGISRTK